jgi:acyl transferase domain-containing protein/acyl carrier protein
MSEDLFNEEVEMIAIVGMSCRFPGAPSLDIFWQNLQDGVESITRFRDDELIVTGVEPATVADPRYVKARGKLEGYDLFDAGFFGFTPSEAAVTDPQHRLFLECAWEAMEHAGYDPQHSGKGTGVFAGAGLNTYALRNLMANQELLAREGEYRVLIGNDKDFVATRTSYKLNLQGPSLNISTACSTSLVAVHYGCSSLLGYQCDMALAGAVSIYIPQDQGYMHEPGGILSADGHCRPFSAEAGGTVGGAGVGVVVLKRLSDALADGDTIHAVIRGTAVNNDGAEKIGFTAPSVAGQTQVIVEAQAIAGVLPESIGYIETHGTGTSLGDPIEIAALTSAFSRQGFPGGVCYLGSVKSNFGHCDTAAGMAGLIKTVLILQQQTIPPTLHCERTHPEIDFASGPFRVNNRLQKWECGDSPRRAGVSSFGVGGTNAHIILEEAVATPLAPGARPWYLLPLSARTESALAATGQRLSTFLQAASSVELDDVAYTLQIGRAAFARRKALLCHDRESALLALQSLADGKEAFPQQNGDEPQVVFLFSGQGTQYVGMGRDLYTSAVLFQEVVDQCAEILQPLLGKDIRQILFPADSGKKVAEQLLLETQWAQPALFVLEYALAKFMIALGVTPKACIGHSLGEYVAACIAGVFSLEDGLRIIAARARCMQAMEKGAMLAVSVAPDKLPDICAERVAVASVNTKYTCVLSGTFADIDGVEELLVRHDIAVKRLHTSHAFHSEMMIPAAEEFVREIDSIEFVPPSIPVISNVTGTWLSDEQATDTGYWGKHLLSTVRFADGLDTLYAQELYVAVELGPGRTLASFTRTHTANTRRPVVCTTVPHVRTAKEDGRYVFPTCLADLWEAGVEIDWHGLYKGERRRRIPLPTYPFERQRYFIDRVKRSDSGVTGGLQRQNPSDWFYRHSWKRAALPVHIKEPNAVKQWLVFTDNRGLGRTLGTVLGEDGGSVHYVTMAESTLPKADDEYRIDSIDTRGFRRLLETLVSDGALPDGIVYCWSVKRPSSSISVDDITANRVLCYDALLLLAQALEQYKPGHSTLLTVVTTGMFEVIGNEQIDPLLSLAMGPVTVLAQEHPHIACKIVDIAEWEGASKSDATMITSLAALCRSRSTDPVTAVRGQYCWVRTFEPVSLPPVPVMPKVRAGGVYLIVGGMGGIGLELAEYLAKSTRGHLLLVSRNGLPERETATGPEAPDLSHEQQWCAFDTKREKIEQECAITTISQRGALETRLNSLCAACVLNFFNAVDISTRPEASYSIHALKQRLGIAPEFSRFFSFLLSVLYKEKLARGDGDRILFLEPTTQLIDPSSEATALAEDFPAFAPMIRFLEHCAESYPTALTSVQEAISVLYPGGDATALGKIGREIEEHTFHRVYCKLLAELLNDCVDKAGDTPVRILEIGGGAGILTRHVMELIGDKNIEYTFTDIGPTFVAEAQVWAAMNGYRTLRFGTLDVSRDCAAQGYNDGSFDVIIELDVVHATPRIGPTLDNLQRLLAPEGVLLMAESTATPRWTTMIYGLAEGWWLYEDSELRPEGPLLLPEKWQAVMSQVGFEDVHVYPLDAVKRREHDCCLVVGKAPKRTAFTQNSGKTAESLRERISRFEAMGATVSTYRADVSNRVQMADVINEVEALYGRIHGVIHSAAIENRGPIQLKELSEHREFAAKVNGTVILDELFRHRSLDFMIICSSITSLLGGVGDVEYTAVNSFADAFAQARATVDGDPGRFTAAVNWDRWIRTGMAVAFEKRFEALSGRRPTGGMLAEEGREAFGRILEYPCGSQIVVSTRPFNDWVREARAGTSNQIADQVPASSLMQARPELKSAYVAPVTETQKLIAAVWQDVLGIEQIGLDDVFSEIGGDSLIAIKVVARLSETLATTITVRTLFEDPTVARLAERIEALRAVASDSENFFEEGETGTL